MVSNNYTLTGFTPATFTVSAAPLYVLDEDLVARYVRQHTESLIVSNHFYNSESDCESVQGSIDNKNPVEYLRNLEHDVNLWGKCLH